MGVEVLPIFPRTHASSFQVNGNILQVQAQDHFTQKIPNPLMLFLGCSLALTTDVEKW